MSSSQIIHRYAKAFYEQSLELNKVDKVLEDMMTLIEVLDENHNLKINLESGGVSISKKLKILNELFGNHFSKETFNLIKFLAFKKRFFFLYQIAKEFMKIHDLKSNLMKLKVILSNGLNESFAKKLAGKIEEKLNKKFHLVVEHDSTLRGGFVYQYGDNVFDFSIKEQLNAIRNKMLS